MENDFKVSQANMTPFLLRAFLIALAVLIAMLALGGTEGDFPPKEQGLIVSATIGQKEISVEIAATKETRERGLSGRTAIPENFGMLFIFEKPGTYSFWMKDMNFPIDIIWLDENLFVIEVTRNVTPQTYPQVFTSVRPAQFVLELPAGFARTNNVIPGTKLSLGNNI